MSSSDKKCHSDKIWRVKFDTLEKVWHQKCPITYTLVPCRIYTPDVSPIQSCPGLPHNQQAISLSLRFGRFTSHRTRAPHRWTQSGSCLAKQSKHATKSQPRPLHENVSLSAPQASHSNRDLLITHLAPNARCALANAVPGLPLDHDKTTTLASIAECLPAARLAYIASTMARIQADRYQPRLGYAPASPS